MRLLFGLSSWLIVASLSTSPLDKCLSAANVTKDLPLRSTFLSARIDNLVTGVLNPFIRPKSIGTSDAAVFRFIGRVQLQKMLKHSSEQISKICCGERQSYNTLRK